MTGAHLPMADGTAAAPVDLGPDVDHGEACITCGDVALPLTVVTVDGGDATCRDEESGAVEVVAIDLVDDVAPGDRVLVHARVAIERLTDDRD